MIIFKKVNDLKQQLSAFRKQGKTFGFVPTMGALHEGHLSLIRLARSKSDLTICSIFVNPTQFNDPEDFNKYPVTTAADIQLLESEGVDILFLPSVEEIYPPDSQPKHYALGTVETMLEGAYRPGHFQGVCQVIDRFLTIIEPDIIVMGQKDYQQVMVIKKLLELTGQQVRLITCPTLREFTGLARSSRNTRLTDEQRAQASIIYSALLYGKNHLATASPGLLIADITAKILSNGFYKCDYVAICNADDLSPIEVYNTNRTAIILVAAFIGNVRLIDNILV